MWDKIIGYVVVTMILVGILAVAIAVRLFITGGEWGCVLSPDPQLCVAVLNK